jgi:hypothetical protein
VSLIKITDTRHRCELPQYLDRFDHKSGEVSMCDGCGRFWRLWLGARSFEYQRVGWWESRRLRRVNAAQTTEEQQ